MSKAALFFERAALKKTKKIELSENAVFLTQRFVHSIMIYKYFFEVMLLKKRFCVLITVGMFVFMMHTIVFASGFLVKSGMQGENVKIVQNLLVGLGYSLGTVDGVCGPATVAAIKSFQSTQGLPVDGVVGEITYSYLNRSVPDSDRGQRTLYMSASAYSAHDPGNSNRTATGKLVQKGLVAVDPNVIPLGTHLYIPGYGEAIAADVGSSIQGNRIDIAFDTHEEAMDFGRQSITVYIID